MRRARSDMLSFVDRAKVVYLERGSKVNSAKVRLTSIIVVGVIVGALVGIVNASSKPPAPIIYRDINYAGTNNAFQNLDLYVPSDAESMTPVVVWIHGGAWVAGDKNHPFMALDLVSRGIAVASINYRLAQNSPHPAQINDCKAAVRWLRANASRYRLDPTRIGCWGHSAGGHLAVLLATTGDVDSIESSATGRLSAKSGAPAPQGRTALHSSASAVQAACDWAGPTDLTSLIEQQTPNAKLDFTDPTGPVAILLGGRKPEECLDASPVFSISNDDAPILIVHGVEDDVVPPAQSQEMYDKVKAAGAPPVELLMEQGEGHTLSSADALTRSINFLEQVLKKK